MYIANFEESLKTKTGLLDGGLGVGTRVLMVLGDSNHMTQLILFAYPLIWIFNDPQTQDLGARYANSLTVNSKDSSLLGYDCASLG